MNISRQVIGVQVGIQGSIHYISDTQLMYPVGYHLGILDLETQSMTFLTTSPHVRGLACIALSPSRELVATGQLMKPPSEGSAGEEKDRSCVYGIAVYSLKTLECLSSFILPHSDSPVLSIAFSGDEKTLASIQDMPTLSLSIWKWHSAKCLATTTLPSRGSRVGMCQVSANVMSVSGIGLMKIWSLAQGELRIRNLLGASKEQGLNFVDHIWHQVCVNISMCCYLYGFISSCTFMCTYSNIL